MYNRIFKNNQITYGVPFQVRIPLDMLKRRQGEGAEGSDSPDESADAVDPGQILAGAREEADMIIKEAQYEASRIMEEAGVEAEKKAGAITEEAWQKGYAEGNEAAREQYEGIIKEAEAVLESTEVEHDKVLAGMEAEIVDMVVEVAEKVIGIEISSSRECLVSLVGQAIEKCSSRNNIILKVSPEDFGYISENKDKLFAMVEGIGNMEIKNELSLKAGSCIIETPLGNVDGGVQTRLRKIEEAFREILEGR